jgi:hypothetical protein
MGVNSHVRDAFLDLISTCSSSCVDTNKELAVCHLRLPELRLRSLSHSRTLCSAQTPHAPPTLQTSMDLSVNDASDQH